MHQRRARYLALAASAAAAVSLIAAPAAEAATSTVRTIAFRYISGTTTIHRGGSLKLQNLDAAAHDVSSDIRGKFHSSLIGTGKTANVIGVSGLAKGTYKYHCSVHPFMHGTLKVT